MQLDLFTDNHPGILLNMVDEFIMCGDPDQAVATCELLLRDYPDNRDAAQLAGDIDTWRSILDGSCVEPAELNSCWLRLDSISHTPLKHAALNRLSAALQSMTMPESVYIEPSFHLGSIRIRQGMYTSAAAAFLAALTHPGIPAGRFLIWAGEALTCASSMSEAMECYLSAFLEDPSGVDTSSITNTTIRELLLSFDCGECTLSPEEEAAWLPAWGLITGVFHPLLLPPELHSSNAGGFAALLYKGDQPLPRLWYDMLAYAESLRTIKRDDRELAEIRRLMKQSCGFMFEAYMTSIRR